MEKAFLKFHKENPHVYTILVSLARRYLARYPGRKLGIGMLYEVCRWTEIMGDTSSTDGFKLNNNPREFYVRLIEKQEADLVGVFTTREQISGCQH